MSTRILRFKNWLILLLIFVVSLMAAWYWGFTSARMERSSDEAVLLIEQVKAVSKVIAIEATISEIYEHSDFWGYDLAPFRKKALVRVRAKVSVGYDLEGMDIVADESKKVITIRHAGSPQILSIDQDLDYYDLSSGWLNTYDEKALSDLQSKARTFIEQKVRDSDLYDQAELQRSKWMKGLEELAQLTGWSVEFSEQRSSIRNFRG